MGTKNVESIDNGTRAMNYSDKMVSDNMGIKTMGIIDSDTMGSMDMGSKDMGSMNIGSMGSMDMGSLDMGSMDIGSIDIGSMDMGSKDMGSMSMGSMGSVDMGSMDMGSMDMGSMMMSPKWFTRDSPNNFLLEGVSLSSYEGITIAIVLAVVFTLLLETLNSVLNVQTSHLKSSKTHTKTALMWSLLKTSILKMASVLIGYVIMLMVMTFNVWLCVAVVIGSGIAHLIVRPLLSSWIQTPASKHRSSNVLSENEKAEMEPLHDFVENDKDSTTNVMNSEDIT